MKKNLFALFTALCMGAGAACGQGRIANIAAPKLTVYLPSSPDKSGRAVIVCPGGGYSYVAAAHEGHDWAHYFNNLGIVCGVLEYNLPAGDRTIPLGDVEKAFKIMADSAAVWKIDSTRIGIMGSSAGGHLAATSSTHPSMNIRPAFQILFYPVISLESAITHSGTRRNFLGENPDEQSVAEFSAYNNVSAATPPAFIALSADDKGVVPENSLCYFSALTKAGVPAAMMIYPTGGHGWGYRASFRYHDQMLDELTAWLKAL